MKNWLLLILATQFLMACSLFGPSTGQKLSIEKRWTRYTISKDYLEFRHLNRFRPILTSDLVIQGNAIDGVSAYSRTTGNLQWRFPIRDGVEGGAQLVEGVLYLGGSDGFFYAYDIQTNKIKWSFPIRSEALGEPLVANGVVYFLAGNNVAYALDAATGRQLWLYSRRDSSQLSIRGASSPTLAGDNVIIGFSDGALVALSKGQGNLVWETNINRNKRFKDADTTPVIDGSNIYVSSFDGGLYCLNVTDGQVLWSIDEGGYGTLLVIDQRLFASTTDGKVISVDKKSGKILWQRNNKKGLSGPPSLYRNMLLVGEYGGSLWLLDQESGKALGEFDPGRGVTSQVAIDEERNEVYFASADANLYSLRVSWTKGADQWPWEN